MLLSYINNPIEFVALTAAFVMSLTIHEFAHAYASDRMGDPTARLLGRLSLNPLRHLDPIGSLMILVAPFGWAKPVPYDPFNLKDPRRDAAIISLAGPSANLLLAVAASILLRLVPAFSLGVLLPVGLILQLMIILNVNLAVFNLIPIHPLDGFKVVEGLLPERSARTWAQLQRMGYVLLLLLVFPILGPSPVLELIQPIINGLLTLLIPGSVSV